MHEVTSETNAVCEVVGLCNNNKSDTMINCNDKEQKTKKLATAITEKEGKEEKKRRMRRRGK